ncbi:Ssk2p [Rhizophagus irregularis DAOM 197198w]|uniref:Ssk2p n=2 Tax=Rhizophagus irregularis TaxID=588596 RepID=A0A015K5K9_RHIIW|nr:Ssk2p [Rhizophagus irregularis DAOM 197198w]
MSSEDDFICKYCDNFYTYRYRRWCQPCEINNLKENFANWTSGNEKIDELIQEMQLKITLHDDMVVKWIPYNQFNNIKEISKDDSATIYSAIWMNGSLVYNTHNEELIKKPNEKVVLKCLYNSRNNINEFSNKAKLYTISNSTGDIIIYGITQNPDTKDYIIVLEDLYCEYCCKIYGSALIKACVPCYLKNNVTNWTSGNEKVDNFIQEMQLEKFNKSLYSRLFEYVPYNQFNDIKQIGKDDSITLYSAIWVDGPLKYNFNDEKYRIPNKKVTLKCLYNSQDITHELLNEAKLHINTIKDDSGFELDIYGITQNPDTKNYIIVLEDGYCEYCGKMYTSIYNKWCKLCQINNLKENFTNWTSGNEKIDNFIQEIQLNHDYLYHIACQHTYGIITRQYLFEWIPYNQFNNINVKEIDFTTLYSAIWMDGPLICGDYEKKWEREPNKEVTLKYLYNLHNITDELLNEIKSYSYSDDNFNNGIYGISQNPDTKDYIIVSYQDSYCKICGVIYTSRSPWWKWCKLCQVNNLKENFANWTSGNEKIDSFIQEMQLKINGHYDTLVEWIPYNKFNYIRNVGKGGFATVYSAIWMDGPLRYNGDKMEYERKPIEEVALKCLNSSQNITNEFLNEVKKYFISYDSILPIYGISQNPDTKNYIMVFKYAQGGNFNNYISNHVSNWIWSHRLKALSDIIKGLIKIHKNKMVHRDLHTGNILSSFNNIGYSYVYSNYNIEIYISDMGLCEEVNNIDETKIYGVMPFVAPEVLKGKPYTQESDIYSFGMIMYFTATTRQPFANDAHDNILALKICNGNRPEINELEAPKCYIDLMKRCWDSNPDKRPNAIEIEELIKLFCSDKNEEFKKQFEEAEEYRKANPSSIKSNQLITHPQACYTSRLLNPYTKDLSNLSVENFDFTR